MAAITPEINEVWIKHTVFGVPSGRTEFQIKSRAEFYMWRIYVDGDPLVLQKIDKVTYRLDPSFPRALVESTIPEKNFEYIGYGYSSIQLEFYVYVRKNADPYTGTYYLDITKSNHVGERVPFA